jgi:hypothetical protein
MRVVFSSSAGCLFNLVRDFAFLAKLSLTEGRRRRLENMTARIFAVLLLSSCFRFVTAFHCILKRLKVGGCSGANHL